MHAYIAIGLPDQPLTFVSVRCFARSTGVWNQLSRTLSGGSQRFSSISVHVRRGPLGPRRWGDTDQSHLHPALLLLQRLACRTVALCLRRKESTATRLDTALSCMTECLTQWTGQTTENIRQFQVCSHKSIKLWTKTNIYNIQNLLFICHSIFSAMQITTCFCEACCTYSSLLCAWRQLQFCSQDGNKYQNQPYRKTLKSFKIDFVGVSSSNPSVGQ